ncbi:hypothetical protein [Actinomyces polynesiensis]|uniref:hypothetical protein n=1 Tax=Actinomyces polynesiensis TaxID=1325934 RepID=UPI0005BE8571|nr:hypothetical protein [Actinomyces polynesiensis]
MKRANEIRPGRRTEADQDHGQAITNSLASADRLCALLSGVFVAVVEDERGHLRRRTYLSLSAAQHAVERAQDRGHDAQVVLCQLAPVGVIA